MWLTVAAARAEMPASRPDLRAARPIAVCKLQSIDTAPRPQYAPSLVGFYSPQRPADDPLAHYERTPLGDWPKPADAARDDPWLRLLLLAPTRPVVIDLAVFIDGRPFRESREAWIDALLAGPPAGAAGADAATAGNKASALQGTTSADESSEAAAAAGADAESARDEGPQPRVETQTRQAPTMRNQLKNYLAAVGTEVDRSEIHWLVAEWGTGPAVVLLDASRSWQRASTAPLLSCLDQDADGSLSAAEIAQADALLKRTDVNGNDLVEASEMRRAAAQPAATSGETGHSLLMLLDATSDWNSLGEQLGRLYPGRDEVNANSPPQRLSTVAADLTLRVDFSTADEKETGDRALSLLFVAPSLTANGETASATSNVIAVDIEGHNLEISAAQGPAAEGDAANQLAIGAVIDGNPLLRLLDRNGDGRLTLRERRELVGLLAALDRDGDGRVSAAEVPVPLRLAVTLGPQVHELLAKPVAAARHIAPRDVPQTPGWFLSMDKNKDGDLSRGEFLGTTEQFRQFDENGDQLLSVAEAVTLNP